MSLTTIEERLILRWLKSEEGGLVIGNWKLEIGNWDIGYWGIEDREPKTEVEL